MRQVDYDTLIIGGGPAGTGLLLKALKDGTENKFLNKRVALVERSSQLIKGTLTQYQINSDTLSDVFLECLEGETSKFIPVDELQDEIDFIRSHKGRSIPLHQLDGYYSKLGSMLQEALQNSNKCVFFMNSSVWKIIRREDGFYEVFVTSEPNSLTVQQIIIATGGTPHSLTNDTLFADQVSLIGFQNKTIHSDTFLKSGLPEELKTELKKKPHVVILGGSHSALSSAYHLLNSTEVNTFSKEAIKIWCLSLPKVFFNSKEDAISHGYTDFTEDDFCPVTKKLYRLAGLRMDGRNLYMRMLGLGQLEKEERVSLKVFTDQKAELLEDLRDATLVISALGYKFNMIPFFNKGGKEIRFKGEKTNHWVNDNCELLDENGTAVPNVYASGLASGFIPKGDLGGELSFQGQTNGIWYYQNALAGRIMSNLE